jgi:hypothetical protein
MTQQKTITAVKIDNAKITISYETDRPSKHKFICEEEASPSFYSAVQAFLSLFIESAGLDSEYWGDGTVKGIKLTHDDAGTAIAIFPERRFTTL